MSDSRETPGLVVEDLDARYGSARVLSGVSLAVGPGELVGLVGPNGAGKTTTLRAISGLIRRASGTISLDGVRVPPDPARAVRMGVVHVPQGRELFATMTVRENLLFACAAVGGRLDREGLDTVLEVFPALEPQLDRYASLLSGGQAQMVAIARGLLARPRILMIDELSLGLAPKLVTSVLDTLSDLAASQAIGLLLVDQNVRALSRVCHHLVAIRAGRSEVLDQGDDAARAAYFD